MLAWYVIPHRVPPQHSESFVRVAPTAPQRFVVTDAVHCTAVAHTLLAVHIKSAPQLPALVSSEPRQDAPFAKSWAGSTHTGPASVSGAQKKPLQQSIAKPQDAPAEKHVGAVEPK